MGIFNLGRRSDDRRITANRPGHFSSGALNAVQPEVGRSQAEAVEREWSGQRSSTKPPEGLYFGGGRI